MGPRPSDVFPLPRSNARAVRHKASNFSPIALLFLGPWVEERYQDVAHPARLETRDVLPDFPSSCLIILHTRLRELHTHVYVGLL